MIEIEGKKYYSKERFILHRHDQEHKIHMPYHLDLRFSVPSQKLIYSFAIPKPEKLPMKIGDKCLCIKGNDHGRYFLLIKDLEIPPGQHGTGIIKQIQAGDLLLEGISKNYLTFVINDPKGPLDGRFLLLLLKNKNLKSDKYKGDSQWIFMKVNPKTIVHK